MTWEFADLVRWLRKVGDGAVRVATAVGELDDTVVDEYAAAGWLTFTEPNLSFAVGADAGSRVELLIGLSHESAAPPVNRIRPKRSQITVMSDRRDVEAAADALQEQLTAYPPAEGSACGRLKRSACEALDGLSAVCVSSRGVIPVDNPGVATLTGIHRLPVIRCSAKGMTAAARILDRNCLLAAGPPEPPDAGWNTPAMTPPDANERQGRIERLTAGLAEHLLAAGIDGHGRLPSAAEVAEREGDRGGDHDAMVARIVNRHTALAGGEGFVTGLGGFVTLPIAIPANIIGFYVLATRMTASIAAASGYDVTDPVTRSAVLLCLSGQDANDILRGVGLGTGGSHLATRALSGLPPSVLMVVNKGVAFRIVTGIGKRSLRWLGRGVPLAGGVIGAGLDAVLIRRIAKIAREQFPPVADLAATSTDG